MNLKNNIKKICHVTSVHPRYDIRIFEKECKSLSKYYDVQLVVADDLGDEIIDDINILDVGKEKNRFRRMFVSTWKIYKKIKNIDASVFHFHDPELIPIGMLLILSGKKIIFDIHENIYEQVKIKEWIPNIALLFLLPIIKVVNVLISINFNLILAEISYSKIYSKRKNKYIINILNYPKINMLEPYINNNRIESGLFYIGNINNYRGLDVILDSLLVLKENKIKFTMHFVGILQEEIDWESYSTIREYIKFYGYLNMLEGYEISKKCKVGLAILKPVGNYIESVPTKIFEYMSVKMPYIASDFKTWRDYFTEEECGIYVNPESYVELSKALEHLLTNQKLVNQLGYNGRRAIEHRFNWKSEEVKLFTFYKNILTG